MTIEKVLDKKSKDIEYGIITLATNDLNENEIKFLERLYSC